MRKDLPILGVLLPLLLCGSSQPAWADPFVINFTVTVTETVGALEEPFGVPIRVGDVVRGSFTHDPSAPEMPPPGTGIYLGAGHTMRIDIGPGLILPIRTYSVLDNGFCFAPGDCDAFSAGAYTEAFPGFVALFAAAHFLAPAASRHGTALPQSLAEIASIYNRGEFNLTTHQSRSLGEFEHGVFGTLALQQTPEPVPEPATLILFGTGVAGLIARRHRYGWRRGCSSVKLSAVSSQHGS